MAAQQTCSAETLATLFSVSKRRIYQLYKQGIVKKAGRGEYQLASSIQSYIKYLQDLAGGQGTADLWDSRARLSAANAEKAELEVQQLKGELIDVELLIGRLSDLFTTIRQRFLVIPKALGNRVDHETRTFIKEEIADTLTQVSDWIENGHRGDLKANRNVATTTKRTDGKRVGGRKSTGQSRRKLTTRKVEK